MGEIIILFSILLAIFILVILSIYAYMKIELEKEKFYSESDFKAADDLLHDIIDDELANYRVLHYEYQEDLYINEEEQNRLIQDLTVKVHSRITPAAKSIISISYDIEDDKKLLALIVQKVSLHSIAYVKEINNLK